jgi:hypothetical protein
METKRTNQEKLWRLADALIDDVLSTSDEDILRELDEDDCAEALKAEITADIEAAKARLGKAKLAAARRAVSSERRTTRPQHRFTPQQARTRLSTAMAGSAAASRVTLAARHGGAVPDEDLEGLIEDASDLGMDLGDHPENNSDSG